MIRIAKKAGRPKTLARGDAPTLAQCAAYDASTADYRDGTNSFEFNSGIYGAAAVKKRLKREQDDKCCFCEAIFDANAAGDVEHYRPKGAVQNGQERLRPGYYWLAYTWENLFYACPDCNQYRKRDLFPLVDEAMRVRDHHGAIENETPLLLNPSGPEDPRDHIGFAGEVARPFSDRGDATIDLIQLDRDALARDRRRHLEHLSAFYGAILLLEADTRPEAIAFVADIRGKLAAAQRRDAKFSAASIDHIAALERGESLLPA